MPIDCLDITDKMLQYKSINHDIVKHDEIKLLQEMSVVITIIVMSTSHTDVAV